VAQGWCDDRPTTSHALDDLSVLKQTVDVFTPVLDPALPANTRLL
jgi:hypothetical protein